MEVRKGSKNYVVNKRGGMEFKGRMSAGTKGRRLQD